ncbi:MAG: hypothetical protein MUF83_03095 [Acidimicrobiales bacterium]|jgi:hypothetical protein|nr:hypothetical protein [Acidimicrobiales bacterium]
MTAATPAGIPSRRSFLGTGLAAAGLAATSLGGLVTEARAVSAQAALPALAQAVGPEALPPVTAGAQVLSAMWHDAAPMTAGSTLGFTTFGTTGLAAYATPNGQLGVRFHVPPGSQIVRVDVYLYRTSAGSITVGLLDHDVTTGEFTTLEYGPRSGTGLYDASSTLATVLGAGHVLQVTAITSSPTAFFVGAICQYLPITTQFAPTTPARVYDSRWPASSGVPVGALTGPSFRYVSVADRRNLDTGAVIGTAVPAGTRAIAYNLTITATTGAGFLTVNPGGVTTIGSSAINWSGSGVTLANASVVAVSSLRAITLVAPAGCSTHAVVDVNGFYL